MIIPLYRNYKLENIAQHGAAGGLQSLEHYEIVSRVLDRHRGGFCYELNDLFGHLLEHHFDYTIHRFLSIVADADGKFDAPPLHLLLLCSFVEDDERQVYLVDVAFGEPSIHPLRYTFDMEQITPEGMRSTLTKVDDTVTLSWYQNGQWVPRLQWSYHDSMPQHGSTSCDSLMDQLRMIQHPDSIFSQKLIVCKVSRTQKITLAGARLKITGNPRFPPPPSSMTNECYNLQCFENGYDDAAIFDEEKKEEADEVVDGSDGVCDDTKSIDHTFMPTTTILEFHTDMEVRIALRDYFGIPLNETIDMDLTKSTQADPLVWSQM